MQKNMWKIFGKETLQIVVPELLRETGYVQKKFYVIRTHLK